ncbi:MAG: tetratricopeptide repeat protein, partial [Terriglobales bacterium]
ALEKDRELRFQHASEMRSELLRLRRDSESGSGARAPSSGVVADDNTVARFLTPVPSHAAPGAGTTEVQVPLAGRANFWKIALPALLVLVLLPSALYLRARRSRPLTDRDTIVLADFSNSTGDPVFDDTLKTALGISLRQSPFLNVLSDTKAAQTLQLMTRAADTKLTPEVARELCQRVGGKAYLSGSIASLGSSYVLGLKAVSCINGDTLAQKQVTAASKEAVLDTLGETASGLRGELGESLATVQRFDVPLAQATTASLEALKAYSLGRKAEYEKGTEAISYFEHAIQLDPNFAMAYWEAGNIYSSRGEPGKASGYLSRAFQLRERTNEREKLHITVLYYLDVTGELEKAAEIFREHIENYPREYAAYENLGIVYADQGQYEKALEVTRQGLRLEPNAVAGYDGVANCTLALHRFDETRQVIHEVQARKLDDFIVHDALYILAFFEANSAAMAEQQQWFASHAGYQDWGAALASDTEAYGGHLGTARKLTKRAVDAAIREDSRENGAIWQAIAAQREVAFGNAAEGRQKAAEALQLSPASSGAEAEAALAFAMGGESARAESLALDLGKRFPLNTQMQALWLPAIQAQLALEKKDPPAALTALQAASAIELGSIPFVSNLSCLYPTYVRGTSYLSAGKGAAAAAEFQKIIDHSGIVGNCWTGALAQLGAARADAVEARTLQGADADAARVRALAAYKDFLTLWKDADPDIPIFKEAKAEYAKLQ